MAGIGGIVFFKVSGVIVIHIWIIFLARSSRIVTIKVVICRYNFKFGRSFSGLSDFFNLFLEVFCLNFYSFFFILTGINLI